MQYRRIASPLLQRLPHTGRQRRRPFAPHLSLGRNGVDEPRGSDNDGNYLWDRRGDLVHRAEISLRYHRYRERFFDRIDKSVKTLTILAGSAAALTIFGSSMACLAFTVVTINAVALACSIAERSRAHSALAQRFANLLVNIASKGERDFNETDLTTLEVDIRKVEVDEPAALPVVVCQAQNDYERSIGHESHIRPISSWRAHVGQFIPISPSAKKEGDFQKGGSKENSRRNGSTEEGGS